MISYETMTGKVTISENYLSKLIGNEVVSCFGVVDMIPSNNKQKLTKLFRQKNATNTGIAVTGNADAIDVEVHIAVTYGMNINAMAASITEKVKYVVKEAADIDVDKVIIKVDGIKN